MIFLYQLNKSQEYSFQLGSREIFSESSSHIWYKLTISGESIFSSNSLKYGVGASGPTIMASFEIILDPGFTRWGPW